ncbi:hypothetical protein [Marilutibacter aestuarii]|uniref:DUF4034 domain-containing protein n=1 Tax=Marilutibacter aestuarii TaxID=1706195 RepID=A0A508ANF5_9GAMM|nr:hypothetical protein [Lysobacter aestuarii]TQD51496.1 hypothetical protein FKV25_01065 [Lysobacter aestuarii]
MDGLHSRALAWLTAGVAAVMLAACGEADRSPDAVAGAAGDVAVVPADAAPAPATSTGRPAPVAYPSPDGTSAAMQQWYADYDAAILSHLRALAARGDPYAHLALAMMLPLPDAPDQTEALERARMAALREAARLAPDDPLLAWMELQFCMAGDAACDRDAALARLQAIAPDNAAHWLPSLADAWEQGDAAATDRYLGLAAAADHVDFHYGDVLAMLTEATRDAPIPPLDARTRAQIGRELGLGRPATDAELAAISVSARAAAYGLPPFNAVMATCRPDPVRPMTATRSGNCRRLMSRLAVGSSLYERALGLAGMVRLTQGRPEGAEWREQLRRFLWIQQQYPQDALTIPGYWEAHVYQGEMVALEALLRRQGRLEPPDDWLPANPRQRERVLTGGEPPGA